MQCFFLYAVEIHSIFVTTVRHCFGMLLDHGTPHLIVCIFLTMKLLAQVAFPCECSLNDKSIITIHRIKQTLHDLNEQDSIDPFFMLCIADGSRQHLKKMRADARFMASFLMVMF